jgi:hypothetical protein
MVSYILGINWKHTKGIGGQTIFSNKEEKVML